MPAQDRQLSVKQLLVALLSFLLLCGVGGGILAATAIPLAATTGTAANAVTRVFDDLPTEIDFTRPSEQSVILAADGSTIANFYAENRIIVTSENISQYLKDGAVAIEDERFYEHNGIDPQGLAGAAFNNLTGGALAGGSTITQQYVKNAMIEEGRINNDAELIASATERSIARKLNEARFAIAVENQMTKDEILTGYLNLAQFGPSQYGVEAAAQHYFSTSAKDVTLEQAAMLVGITQAPGRWDPINHPEDAKTRRDTVLGQMYNLGTITRDQLEAAVAVSIEDMLNVTNTFNGCAEAGISAYYCEYVVKEVLESELLGETREERVQELYRGGLTIKTTLDPVQQQAAYDAVVGGVPVGDPSSIEMAMSVVEPGTGQIKAMVQNTNFGNPTEDDPTATRVNLNVGQRMGGGDGFQSGSTFKVFTLIEWLDSGRSPRDRVNAANGQTFPSEEWTMSCAPGFATMPEPYAPKNIEGIGSGMMTVLDITRQSVNTGYVNMSSQLDVCDIVDKASALGVERGTTANAEQAEHYTSLGLDSTAGEPLPLEPNPSQVLGTNPVTPLSMANSMASLAAEGEFCRAYSFTEITNAQGEVLASQEPECRQVIDIDTARATTAVLEQVVDDNATGFRAQLQGGRPAAGKTGTANMDWHAWFMGYTPQLATAIWQGHMEGNVSMFDSVINGNYHLEVFGGLYPALAFKSFMDVALADEPIEQFQRPLRSLGSTSSFDQDSDESASDYDSERNSEPDSDSDSDSDSNSDSDTDDNQNQSAVPNVVGMGPDEAGQILLNNGYGYAIGTDYSDLPPGVVARQSPGPNSNAAPGTIVNLWLSIGPDPNAG